MSKLILNRRRFLNTAAATGAMLASPAYLRRASAQSGGEVNIWTYNNFVPEAFKKQFEADTGIKVNVRLVDDQGKQFNLLAAEQPNPTVDIMTVAGHRFLQFIDSELLAPLDTDRLTNWNKINPTFSESDWSTINGNKWGAPILSGMEVLSYNSEIVSEEEALTWDTLFSEKYKGQTAYIIQDMMSIVMLMKGYDGNMVAYMDDPEKAAAIVEEAKQFLIEKKPLVRKYYDGGAEFQQMMVNQDIVLGHSWNGPAAALINDGFPLGMAIPKEGSYGFVYTYNIANNAPNADNAYTFLDAILSSPEIGAAMTKASGFISTYKDASNYLNDLEKKSTSFPDEQLANLQFFRAEANEMKYGLVDPAVEAIKAA
ncbi:ABC transporter substrate-binding protein [Mameliella sediminis]|uniref:ABC transporter substrate-binding protein n=1 Tax=Mameliella sediminis TaxID=2836866 RepID=UPI001C48B101|nr:extracellular solute-binding protein [Mameliella sediminis]MBY6113753.1 extracellular solute-binding protein [Antarctobacter heliothermus]MBY6142899.1 extracellular solute-binding protein [Mameliella alba]MBV7395050.1 extracellular solute-binding protein [Mameliella sediminis]MBY6159754.1 extracellular solute-binding protein [Mameliella alba]MBY6168225.1 extracellular solute-binding protein [Mameliella alba]